MQSITFINFQGLYNFLKNNSTQYSNNMIYKHFYPTTLGLIQILNELNKQQRNDKTKGKAGWVKWSFLRNDVLSSELFLVSFDR